MSIDSVNNSGSNAGLYAGGAALVGAGAGAVTGYYTKPFLQDDAPTDSFIKEIRDNITGKNLQKMKSEIDKLKNIDELKEYVKNNNFFEESGMTDFLLEQAEKCDADTFKANLNNGISATAERDAKTLFNTVWDKDANKFVENSNVMKEDFEAVKNIAKKFRGKAAMLYGAIGAGVLGLATLLCCTGGKKDAPADAPQKVDTQV